MEQLIQLKVVMGKDGSMNTTSKIHQQSRLMWIMDKPQIARYGGQVVVWQNVPMSTTHDEKHSILMYLEERAENARRK